MPDLKEQGLKLADFVWMMPYEKATLYTQYGVEGLAALWKEDTKTFWCAERVRGLRRGWTACVRGMRRGWTACVRGLSACAPARFAAWRAPSGLSLALRLALCSAQAVGRRDALVRARRRHAAQAKEARLVRH
jgi:hypothetical protein